MKIEIEIWGYASNASAQPATAALVFDDENKPQSGTATVFLKIRPEKNPTVLKLLGTLKKSEIKALARAL